MESYSLAHYFATNYCKTDAFEKRGIKGVLITIGDEPNLNSYPARVLNEIMGSTQAKSWTAQELLEEAQKQWEVFHINPRGGSLSTWRNPKTYWDAFLNQNYIETDDYRKIPDIISELVIKVAKASMANTTENKGSDFDIEHPLQQDSSDGPVFL